MPLKNLISVSFKEETFLRSAFPVDQRHLAVKMLLTKRSHWHRYCKSKQVYYAATDTSLPALVLLEGEPLISAFINVFFLRSKPVASWSPINFLRRLWKRGRND